MKTRYPLFAATTAMLLSAAPAIAQQGAVKLAANDTPAATADSVPPSSEAEKKASLLVPPLEIQNMRPNDQRGLYTFEDPKSSVPFTGFKVNIGAAFAQQFQDISHRNTALANPVTDATGKTTNMNQLADIGWGMNLPTANLSVNAQLAPGIRVALESYLSSRHHQESWVKGGYLLIDQSPIDVAALNSLMQYVTLKVGMYPINYGDAHFRRSDNGNVMYNPFVGNYILDAWTFEPGAEVIVREPNTGLLAVGGITTGNNSGNVLTPEKRGPAFLGKIGFDKQVNPLLRVRLTGSGYTSQKTTRTTLYHGDRAGSRYYFVMENTLATADANPSSGLLDPGFSAKVTGLMLNPFVKIGGLEFFGVAERGQGRAASETANRTVHQYAGDLIYRFLPGEKVYVGGRYNTFSGRLQSFSQDVSVDRAALAAGWFVTPTVVLKGEWVTQKYNDFPTMDIRNGGKFHGFVVEGGVNF
jgi:hypothetical protein